MKSIIKFGLAGVALAAMAWVGTASAQDSGTGIDLVFGNKLDPSGGSAHTDCDPRGMSWLREGHRRTPSGALYICAPEVLEQAVGDWVRSGQLSVGWLHTGGDSNSANWLRFADWEKGLTLGFLGLDLVRPQDGSYFELRASRLSRNSQYAKLTAGRAGKYRIDVFGRSQPNVLNTGARSIWDGVGGHDLTLTGGLVPGASTPAQVAAVSAAVDPIRLQVTRDKAGLGVNYFFNPRWTGYFSVSNETRSGARPFGGAFFFNYPFPDNGGILETPRPIEDSTINLNTGLRYVGNVWRMDLAYTGSAYRSRRDFFEYDNPFALWSVVPGAEAVTPLRGQFAAEPDNDYHNVRATLTRKLAMNGEFSMRLGGGSMRQNERLLPPANCMGSMGIDLSPTGAPVNPFLFDCANWNTPAALSRERADMRIDTTTADANLVLLPRDTTTVRANVRYRREDYRNVYLAYNPITGQYGYVAENGAQGAVVPDEMGIYDLIGTPGVVTRIRSLPLDKEVREVTVGVTEQLNRGNSLGASFTYTETARTHREVNTVKDQALKLTWVNRALERMTFRANYQYLDRSGGEYDYDPYEFTFSSSLPGFSYDPAAISPHTVDALRKYDVAKREQHKLTFISSFMPVPEMSFNASLRGDWNDYQAELGRQGYDTYGLTLSWDWQPGLNTSTSAYVGWDRSKLAMANINEIDTAPDDASLGGAVYDEAGRWWIDDTQRNLNAGITFRHAFARAVLDASWNHVQTRGTTQYRYASAAALAWPDLVEAGNQGQYPAMTYRSASFHLGVKVPFSERVSVRLFDTWERGSINDWHYLGLDDGLVVDHRVYLEDGAVGSGSGRYRANLVGVMLEVKL